MGKQKEQTFTYNCQHVGMIDSTQCQETNFEERRKVTFIGFYFTHVYQFPPSFPGIVTP